MAKDLGEKLDIGQTLGFAWETIAMKRAQLAILILGFAGFNAYVEYYSVGFAWLLNLASTIALTVLATQLALKIRCGDDIIIIFPFGRALLVTILYQFGMIFGFILLVVPGVLIAVGWSVAIPALMAEDIGTRRSLGRSMSLTRNNRWPLLGMILMVSVPLGIVSFWGDNLAKTFFGTTVDTGLPFIVISGIIKVAGTVLYDILLSETYISLSGKRDHLAALREVFA